MAAENSCAVAHGESDGGTAAGTRTLVAVFASPVADYLIRYGKDLGYRTVLVEPERARVSNAQDAGTVATAIPADLGADTDVVVTDHHRVELGPMLRDALTQPVRWVGVMGNPRHPAPHI